jgi:hypothetical protein
MSTIKNYGVPLDQESIQGYAQELTGWAYYIDDEHDVNNPFVVNETQKLVIPNNAANVLKEQIPVGTDPLYDGVANKITPDTSGDAYLVRIGFKRFTSSNTGYGEITLDIGQAEPILDAPVNFPRGSGANNARSFVVTELVFSGDDFVGNGGSLYYESVRGNTSIYDIRYLIARVHKAR